MRNKLITKASKLLLLTLVAGLFAGCAATRPVSDAALGAGGAYLGHEISNGDPLVTAAGAAGGVVVSETLHYVAKKQAEKAYVTGYDKGKSDAVKQQYWLYVSMQKQRNQISSVRLYPVQLPEQRIDGHVPTVNKAPPHRVIETIQQWPVIALQFASARISHRAQASAPGSKRWR